MPANYVVTGANFQKFLELTVRHDISVRERWHALIIYGLTCYAGEGMTPKGNIPNKGDPGILNDIFTKMISCHARGIEDAKRWVSKHSSLVWSENKNRFTTRRGEVVGEVTLSVDNIDRYWLMRTKKVGKCSDSALRVKKVTEVVSVFIDDEDSAISATKVDADEIKTILAKLLTKLAAESYWDGAHRTEQQAMVSALAHMTKHLESGAFFDLMLEYRASESFEEWEKERKAARNRTAGWVGWANQSGENPANAKAAMREMYIRELAGLRTHL
mgnify:CR=1 FL=1